MISVIVPVYNIEQCVGKCIRSLIRQSYKELEIILVDDGSSDRSGAICDKYAKKDSRIKVIHKTNGGLSDARNHGIDIATGEFIAFVDGDDYIDAHMYEELMRVSESVSADICMSRIIQVDENGVKEELFKNNFSDCETFDTEAAMRLLATEVKISTCAWNKLYRTSLFDGIRFPKGKIHEDQFVMYKLFHKSKIVAISKKACYYYVYRKNSITNIKFNINRMDDIEACEERIVFFEKEYPKLVKYAKAHLFHQAVWIGYIAWLAGFKDAETEKRLAKIYKTEKQRFIFCPDYSPYHKANTLFRIIQIRRKRK